MLTTTIKTQAYNVGYMKELLQATGKQLVPILISAGAAAGLAFLQSLGHASGICPAPIASPAEVGLLGGGIHMVIMTTRAALRA